MLSEVELTSHPLERFARLVGRSRIGAALGVAAEMAERLAGRVFWNINSTAVGGGVAEMLQPLVGYARGVGVDARWLVIRGNPDFFRVTKRLHHALHGSAGDGTPLGPEARRIYEQTLADNAAALCERVRPNDFVLLHDPQTAGLAPALLRHGARVIWRSHIGSDGSSAETDSGWRFLERYLGEVPRYVFSREAYVPPFFDHGKAMVIRPSIDAFSAKNRELPEALLRTTLVHTGLVEGPPPERPSHRFKRSDGSWGRIRHHADLVRLGRAPTWNTPLVVQVSRWDPLKDPVGVMLGFAALVNGSAPANADLVLAGPNVTGVTDDPEGGRVLDEVVGTWRSLPHEVRRRIHIASLPTSDVEENAIIVNALQRHASVVVQKSLREGFGLTVTEAMWKARPIVATAIGGIQDQIEDGVSGILLKEPRDLQSFGQALRFLLANPGRARSMGQAARRRARDEFLGVRHLLEYAQLLRELGI